MSIRKSILLLIILNLFFIASFTLITWDNIYVSGSIGISVANHAFNIFLELLVLNGLLLLFGSMQWILAKILLLVILCAYYTIFMLQTLSISISGSPIVLAGFYNINEASLLINTNTITVVVTSLTIFLILLYSMIKNRFSYNSVLIYLVILAIGYPLALKYKHSVIFKQYGMQAEQHQYASPASPARDFIKIAKLYLQEKSTDNINIPSQQDLKIAARFNLAVNPDSYYPFLKKRMYEENLPTSGKKANSKHPNVIVFFVEGLSARSLGVYGNPHKGLTPNIDEFAQHSMVVKGYYNHSTPTAPGLYGQHCSIYPLLTGKQMKMNNNPIANLGLKCYPQYFKEAGYKTIYFSHTKPGKWHMRQNLGLWGYKYRYFWQDLLNRFLGKEKIGRRHSGISDHQMMRSIINLMKDSGQDKPFLLGVSTIETHFEFKLAKDGVGYAEKSSDTLNMLHNLDHAFGLFWKYFKTSKYSQNTVIVLTGDHTQYASRDYIKAVGKDWRPSIYDEMSLIIYDPRHELPNALTVNATSIDLAPSLLQLADINKFQKNSFLGTSLFDTRAFDAAFAIPPYPDYQYYYNVDGHLVNKKIKNIKNEEDKKIFLSLHNILEYSEYLRSKGRLYDYSTVGDRN